VLLTADDQITTLLDFRYQQHYHAQRGQHGKGKKQEGRSASHLILPVPVGTIVRDSASGEILKDFRTNEESFIVARGGGGGRGNAHFATPTRQAPRFAESGQPGEERWLLLELKLIADVGIVGFPNVGKSTLISKISAVRPKIADYPFTTLVPHLGVVTFGHHKPFVVADIPGIITDAHKGAGLGLRFLRHVERTSLLLHLLDFTAASPRDPVKDYLALNRELSLFSPKLAAKPQVVALNKIDMPEAQGPLKEVRRNFKRMKKEIFPISALTGEGLPRLLATLSKTLARRFEEETTECPIEP
jgi:GTP-binding protein